MILVDGSPLEDITIPGFIQTPTTASVTPAVRQAPLTKQRSAGTSPKSPANCSETSADVTKLPEK